MNSLYMYTFFDKRGYGQKSDQTQEGIELDMKINVKYSTNFDSYMYVFNVL